MPAAMALELAMMTVVLDHLSWPTGLAVAALCRAWCAETADVIRASAWKWQVPLPNEGSPGMLLRALYRGIGLADLVRMRTASTFERFEEGLRVAVFGAWGNGQIYLRCAFPVALQNGRNFLRRLGGLPGKEPDTRGGFNASTWTLGCLATK